MSIRITCLVFAFVTVTGFAFAFELDEIRERAEAMQREAAKLAERGHKKEAANLKRKAMAMLEEAERLQHDHPSFGRRIWSLRSG